MDEMFHVREIRQKINDLCSDAGVVTKWVHVIVSEEEFQKRIKKREGHIMTPKESMKVRSDVAKIFDPFKCKNVIIINNDNNNIQVDLSLFMTESV